MKRASVESLASSSAASPPDDAETVEQLYYEQLKQSQARLTANIRNCAAALLDDGDLLLCKGYEEEDGTYVRRARPGSAR